jgi:hypothetical protein
MMADEAAPELRETFLRQAAQNPGYAVAYALLEVAQAINACAEHAQGLREVLFVDLTENLRGIKAAIDAIPTLATTD